MNSKKPNQLLKHSRQLQVTCPYYCRFSYDQIPFYIESKKLWSIVERTNFIFNFNPASANIGILKTDYFHHQQLLFVKKTYRSAIYSITSTSQFSQNSKMSWGYKLSIVNVKRLYLSYNPKNLLGVNSQFSFSKQPIKD